MQRFSLAHHSRSEELYAETVSTQRSPGRAAAVTNTTGPVVRSTARLQWRIHPPCVKLAASLVPRAITVTLEDRVKSDHAARSSSPDGRHVGFPGSGSLRATIAMEVPPSARHCQPSDRVRAASPSMIDSQPRKPNASAWACTVASTSESPTRRIRHFPSAESHGSNSTRSSPVNASAAPAGDPCVDALSALPREHAPTTAVKRQAITTNSALELRVEARRARAFHGDLTVTRTYTCRHRPSRGWL